MATRLQDLERDLARTAARIRRRAEDRGSLPGRMPGPAPMPNPAPHGAGTGNVTAAPAPVPAPPGTAASLSLPWAARSRRAPTGGRARRVRAFNAVDYSVPGVIPVLRQDKTMACWAFTSNIMASWRAGASLDLLPFLDDLGTRIGQPQKFHDIYDANTGIYPPDVAVLLGALDLRQEPPASFSAERFESMLRDYGPLWIWADENLTKAFAVHARVMVGIHGDGTADGTNVDIVDPGTGTRYRETLRRFIAKYEQLAPTGWAGIQVIHFAAGTRPGTMSLPMSARSASGATFRSASMATLRPAPSRRGRSALLAGAFGLTPPPPPALDPWVPLIRFRPPAAVLSRLTKFIRDGQLHAIHDAYGDLNLDWYPVHVTSLPPGMTAERLLQRWRLDINSTVDQRFAYFEPYDADEATIWTSSAPTGAVIHIDMRSGADWANPDDGSVICGESAADHWTFSTIWTPLDMGHPVSGNRWFGFVPGPKGTYVFGTRGADRATAMIDHALSDIIFASAHALWMSLQQGLVNLVTSVGGTATIGAALSDRYDWPAMRSTYHV